MKALLMGLLLAVATSVNAVPNIFSVAPHCVENVHALPIFSLEVIREGADGASISVGTTFLIAKDTWVTAAHVVEGDVIDVAIHATDSQHVDLEVVYMDADADVAILTAPSSLLAPLPLTNRELSNGEMVYTVGLPGYGGEAIAAFAGTVTGSTSHGHLSTSFISTGMSGGPVLVCDGDEYLVAGVQTAFTIDQEVRVYTDSNGEKQAVQLTRNKGESLFTTDVEQFIKDALDE